MSCLFAEKEKSLLHQLQEPLTPTTRMKKKRLVLLGKKIKQLANALVQFVSDIGIIEKKRKTTTIEDDIYYYLRSMEVENKRRPMPDYMERMQTGRITPHTRAILIDWLAELVEDYNLVSDTLYRAVSYLDRFLSSSNAIDQDNLRLLAVSCMLIASKYEHMTRTPRVDYFDYTIQETVKMETHVLKFLNYELGNPTAFTFLSRFTSAAAQDGDGDTKSSNLRREFLGCYLAELSLMDYGCIEFLPSTIAASAVFLANFTIRPDMHPWSKTLQRQSGYRPADLKKCVLAIHDLQLNRNGSSLVAIREKYKQDQFECVAAMSSPSQIPRNYFKMLNVGIRS